MKRFKQYLVENIVMDKKFIKNVEQFIFTNNQKYLTKIEKDKSKIPAMFRKGQILFRGMVFDEKTFNSIKEGKGLTFDKASSWTASEKMALRFIKDPSKRIGAKKGIGVIFKKKIPDSDVVLNVQSYILFLNGMGKLDEFDFDELNKEMGIEENETIVSSGIKITNKDIYKTIKI